MFPPAAIHPGQACRPLPLLALQATPGSDLLLSPDADDRPWEEEEELLLCRACRQPVTDPGFAVSRNGSHLHTRSNPAGLVFTIGLFGVAPGCTVTGPPTLNFTWFPGYGWEIASCRHCSHHLGWRFRRDDADLFFGLIIAHLVAGN